MMSVYLTSGGQLQILNRISSDPVVYSTMYQDKSIVKPGMLNPIVPVFEWIVTKIRNLHL